MLWAVDGIQANQTTNVGTTPLSFASSNDHSKVIEMLLKVDGIQLNQAGDDGCTSLSTACEKITWK